MQSFTNYPGTKPGQYGDIFLPASRGFGYDVWSLYPQDQYLQIPYQSYNGIQSFN